MGEQEYDQETALYHMAARYYDPQLGRWLSEDPAGIAVGFNLYAYAGNDPVNGRDPTGMTECTGVEDANGQPASGGHWDCHIDNPCGDGYHIGTMAVTALDGGALGLSGECVSDYGTGPAKPYWIVLNFQLDPVTITASPGAPAGDISTTGYDVNGFVFLGGTVAFGYYEYENGWKGSYFRLGVGTGWDAGVSPAVGRADNLDVLKGGSGEACGILVVSGCRSDNAAGTAEEASAGYSPFRVPLGGHWAYTYGFVTPPKPPEVGTLCVDYWHDWICK